MDKLPRGLTRTPTGIRIRINRGGKKVYDETLYGNPRSAALVAEARAHAVDVREKLSLGLPLSDVKPAPNFTDASRSFLNKSSVDPDVLKKYRNILQSVWMPVFHNVNVKQITDDDIKDRLSSLGVKIKTQKNYVSPLRMVLKSAKVSPNPVDLVQWNEKQVKSEKHTVTRFDPKQQADIIAAIDWLHDEAMKIQAEKPMKRFRPTWTLQAKAYFPMMFAFGARPGEALALHWDDYDGQRVHIHATCSQGKRKEMTKTGESRRVYVPEWVRPRIEALPSRFAGESMFVGNHGKPLLKKNNLNKVWRDALKVCGFEHQDPYVCRHSRAAELLTMGKATLSECAYQMGHTVQVFEDVYAKFIEEFKVADDYSQFEAEVARTLPDWKPGKVVKL